ncbi:MAG: single-stranded DNA-binding protein [Bacteroidota bacterium]
MINKVTLIGNLGRDPEIRRLENGGVVGKFPVATNENYKDKNGEWQSQTEWHDVVVWNALAESAERNLKKGKLVYVEGKLTHRKYTDKNNIERYITEVRALTFRMLERREGGSNNYAGSFPSAADAPDAMSNNPASNPAPVANTPVATESTAAAGGEEGDDLPF